MKAKINKFRFSCLVLAFGGMISGLALPTALFRSARAEEREVNYPAEALPSVEQVRKQMTDHSVEFEENRGQLDMRVRYQARGAGYSLFLTADEAVYVLPLAESRESKVESRELETEDQALKTEVQRPAKMFALRMKIVGANSESLHRGEDVREHRTNYFKGDNPENWQTDVPNFSRVLMQEVYPGISMVWHGKEQGATQYDFVVEPNGNADQIALEFDGAERIELDPQGNLLIYTEAGTIKQTKPFTYQETDGVRTEVESGFVIEQSQTTTCHWQIRFSLGDYDRSKPLTIDPYSTFMGGSGDDRGYSIAVDAANNVFVAGRTQSINYPTTAGTFDTTYSGDQDVFVTKLNAAGSAPIYSTYIGGSNIAGDFGQAIAVDSSGNAYLTGMTSSTDYPTTAGAFDTTYNGAGDVFVTKLNAAGSALIYSTFIGGSGSFDNGLSIAVDSSGNAYLTGETASTDYPTTAGAFGTTFNGNRDAFVTKLSADGSTLTYSTFLGGSQFDVGWDIAVDSLGSAYLTGETFSTNYPTTAGAFDTTYNGSGNEDVFVTKLNAAGTALIYSTYIGDSGGDRGFGIAVDASGDTYLTGETFSTNYPTTAGAFDTTYNSNIDAFVTKLNAAGSALIYSTYIGGNESDSGQAIAVDSLGNAYLTGFTFGFGAGPRYPTTVGAFDTTHNGVSDAVLTMLNADGSALLYSTFIGGSNTDEGLGIALGSAGNIFVTGRTFSSNYPTTAGAFDTTFNGDQDVFVSLLNLSPSAANVSVGGRVTVGNSGLARAQVSLTDLNGATRSVLTSSFGYYRFDGLESGQIYIVSVNHKRYSFATQVITPNEDLTELNFIAEP